MNVPCLSFCKSQGGGGGEEGEEKVAMKFTLHYLRQKKKGAKKGDKGLFL